ncbi:MAG: radical SAM family heme chaperone HemW [Clostridiales Family XIII bacterium]|jgi:oxygen-independent coproporphyrinogen-3 oxidase|nr:radical SAM family heme chaperone HemW [Clostridiales Family XIII bacterium]
MPAGESGEMKLDKKKNSALGIYIHIPFCKHRCRYCTFLSDDETGDKERSLYVAQLRREIAGKSELYAAGRVVDTIFIGGGTPTILPIAEIDDIIEAVYSRFCVADDAEITIEANPGTVDREYLRGVREVGANRISFGVQSFDDGTLRRLGRIHTSREAVESYDAARAAGYGNVNIDLIFGLPDQSVGSWAGDIRTSLGLRPDHISFYDLQLEEETPLYEDVISGRLEALSDIEDRRMYHSAVDALTVSGYEHYEISNAALPGMKSRHNLKYWSMDDYLGFGLGAHSYMDGRRFVNTEFRSDYIKAGSSEQMVSSYYNNTPGDEMSEYIWLGLRRTDGISLTDFSERFGEDFMKLYASEMENLIERKLLMCDGDKLRLTALGLDLSNVVFREFV